MRVQFSKEFAKAKEKLSGKLKESARSVINEVIDASCVEEITDCKKIESLNSVYRIRTGVGVRSSCCMSRLKATLSNLNTLCREVKHTTRKTWSV